MGTAAIVSWEKVSADHGVAIRWDHRGLESGHPGVLLAEATPEVQHGSPEQKLAGGTGTSDTNGKSGAEQDEQISE